MKEQQKYIKDKGASLAILQTTKAKQQQTSEDRMCIKQQHKSNNNKNNL